MRLNCALASFLFFFFTKLQAEAPARWWTRRFLMRGAFFWVTYQSCLLSRLIVQMLLIKHITEITVNAVIYIFNNYVHNFQFARQSKDDPQLSENLWDKPRRHFHQEWRSVIYKVSIITVGFMRDYGLRSHRYRSVNNRWHMPRSHVLLQREAIATANFSRRQSRICCDPSFENHANAASKPDTSD